MTKQKKICVITGTRAEYGILYPVLRAIENHPRLELALIAGGMHLSHEFGYTVREISKDGFRIAAKFDMLLSDDTGGRMARSIGVGILELTQIFEMLKPDLILGLGDREEFFAAAIAGVCLNIPVAHIAGGDLGFGGHIDESIRHSITKFAHIHFAMTKNSAERIKKLGEEPWRIHWVGSSAIDNIRNEKLIAPSTLARMFSLDLTKPLILFLEHPLAVEPERSGKQIKIALEAIRKLRHQTVVIYPNADAGSKNMIEVIKKYEKFSFIKTFQSVPRKYFLSLMRQAQVMIGNSSSGIIEAPSFHLPVVNLGTRQEGRERAANVIDIKHETVAAILKAVHKALTDKKFLRKVKASPNPYGDGKASERIAEILDKLKITKKLLEKKMTY